MPSDERIETALKALADPIANYRAAVVAAAEEVRGYLATHEAEGEKANDGGVAAGLGVFAMGRIDVGRFESLVSEAKQPQDPGTLNQVKRAFDILRGVSADGDDTFYVKMRSGARLRDTIADRFAEIGRAFGAARVAGLARLRVLNGKADDLLQPLAFDGWSTGERRLAPPLVVELEGSDLVAGELTEFLDGNVKIVLLVKGDAPPAPLVRLITPATFVLQTSEVAELQKIAAAPAPAIAALMPAAAAAFLHDPAGGGRIHDRLTVGRLPDKPPRKKLGGMSARQQNEDLEQLRALAAAQELAPAAPQGEAHVTSVDKLAAWLLSNTDLTGAK